MVRIKISAAARILHRTDWTVYKYVRDGLLSAQWDREMGCLTVDREAVRQMELPRRGRPSGVKS